MGGERLGIARGAQIQLRMNEKRVGSFAETPRGSTEGLPSIVNADSGGEKDSRHGPARPAACQA